MNSSDALAATLDGSSLSADNPRSSNSKSCNGSDRDTSLQDSAPSEPSSIGTPSWLRKYDTDVKGSRCRSGRENAIAADACAAESRLMTMCEAGCGGADFRDVAIRDGIRREKVTSGNGSRAMDVNEERVAPW